MARSVGRAPFRKSSRRYTLAVARAFANVQLGTAAGHYRQVLIGPLSHRLLLAQRLLQQRSGMLEAGVLAIRISDL